MAFLEAGNRTKRAVSEPAPPLGLSFNGPGRIFNAQALIVAGLRRRRNHPAAKNRHRNPSWRLRTRCRATNGWRRSDAVTAPSTPASVNRSTRRAVGFGAIQAPRKSHPD